MNRQKLIGLVALVPAAILATSAASCTASGTGNGVFTPAPTSTSAPVGGGAGGTTTPAPTGTTTPAPTGTTTPAPTTTTTPPVVGVPQPGDEDFIELDCADFPLEQAGTDELLSAQDVFDTNRLDIHGLDADGDGTACEDTDPAAVANDNVPDSVDESADDAADVAVAPDAEAVGITVDVQSY